MQSASLILCQRQASDGAGTENERISSTRTGPEEAVLQARSGTVCTSNVHSAEEMLSKQVYQTKLCQ